MKSLLILIDLFYERLQRGDFDHKGYSLAIALEVLADQAWDAVDESFPFDFESDLSIKIE